jgi:hypothetical protein
MSTMDITFDRRASPTLMRVLSLGGPFACLVTRALGAEGRFDVQLRKEPKGSRTWATFYVGLTSVLDLDERHDAFRLRAHRTHREAGGFNDAWSDWKSEGSLAAEWPAVDRYLDRVIPKVETKWTHSEGAVHAAICAGGGASYRVVQREASPSFRNMAARTAISKSIADPLYAAVAAAMIGEPPSPAWWPGVRDHGKQKQLGTAPDILAVGLDGRLLVIEAKPANAIAGIVWGPAQVRFYAELFDRWLDQTATGSAVLAEMLEQRVVLGLAPSVTPIDQPIAVVPMLVIGAGNVSKVAKERVNKVADVLHAVASGQRVQPVEIWRIDETGNLTERWR